MASTAVVAVFNGRFNPLDPAYAQNALVVHMNALVVLQVISDAAVAFVWAFHMDGFNLLGKAGVFGFSRAFPAGHPSVISCP